MVSTKENIGCVHYRLMSDSELTINQITNATSVLHEIVENIWLSVFAKLTVSARQFLCLLTFYQRHTRLIISQENRTLFAADPAGFLGHVLTQHECYIYRFEPETKK